MKNLLKVTSIVLALSVLGALFVSCADTGNIPEDTTGHDVTETESGTEETTERPVDPVPEETFTIYEEGKYNCVIIYPENDSDLIRKSAMAISVELGGITGGLGPLAFSDQNFSAEKYADRCLILVGRTALSENLPDTVYGRVTASLSGNSHSCPNPSN